MMPRAAWNRGSRAASFAALAILLTPLAVSAPNALEPSQARELWDTPHETMMRLKTAQPFAGAVDLGVFGPFQPRITLEDAAQTHGAPERLFQGAYHDHWRYARYKTSRSFVDVAYEPGGDTCGTHHRRTLYAYPAGQPWTISEVLPVAARTAFPQPTRVLIISNDGHDRVWCLVRGGQVHVLNWYRDARPGG